MKEFFSKIETKEQAEKVIREVSIVLYVVAAIDLLLYVLYLGKMVYVGEVVLLVLTGLLLRRSRSRSIAVVVAAYAIFIGILTFLARAGIYHEAGGQNVIVALIVIFTAIRGVNATWVYHRIQGTQTNTRGVVVLTAVAAVLTLVVFVGGFLLAAANGYDLDKDSDSDSDSDSDAVGQMLVPFLVAPWFLVFGRVLPFLRRIRVTKAPS